MVVGEGEGWVGAVGGGWGWGVSGCCLHCWLVERSVPVRQTDRVGGGPVSATWHHLSDLLLFFLRLLLGLTWPGRAGPGREGLLR